MGCSVMVESGQVTIGIRNWSIPFRTERPACGFIGIFFKDASVANDLMARLKAEKATIKVFAGECGETANTLLCIFGNSEGEAIFVAKDHFDSPASLNALIDSIQLGKEAVVAISHFRAGGIAPFDTSWVGYVNNIGSLVSRRVAHK
jgi:hypothetical protein